MKTYKTINVRRWSAGSATPLPEMLDETIAALFEAREEIPAEYRNYAYVDCGPVHEYGEAYESIRVAYTRPMTPDERAEDARADLDEWRGRYEEARERMAAAQELLRKLGVVA
jgi:hypothetical protein